MCRLIAIFVCVMAFTISCASVPASQENSDFQKETGVSLSFVKRGIYSLAPLDNVAEYNEFFKKLMRNEILFSVNEAQNDWAVFSEEAGIVYISVNDLFKRYDRGSNNALLTSTIWAIGHIRMGVQPELVEKRFYEIISDYQKYGVDVSKITSDELFTGKKFKIGNTGITFEWRG